MEHKTLWLCSRCLMGIEAHEGKQQTFVHYADESDEEQEQQNGLTCDWCEQDGNQELYELI